jgi:hypothetical protein
MQDKFVYKPPNTRWIKCELFVSYECDVKPKVEDVVITGIKQFGFILSTEYDIKASVEESERRNCTREECDTAIEYHFNVKCSVYEKIGLGFGLGSGTGTLGWTRTSIDYFESFTTRCICCDQEAKPTGAYQYAIEPMRSLVETRRRDEIGVAAVGAFAALLAGVEYSVTHVTHLFSQIFLLLTGLTTALSALVMIWRLLVFRLRKNRIKNPDIMSN